MTKKTTHKKNALFFCHVCNRSLYIISVEDNKKLIPCQTPFSANRVSPNNNVYFYAILFGEG